MKGINLEEWRYNFNREADGLLHRDHWNLEFDYSIQPKRSQRGWKEYITKTSARFWCSLCPRGWPSKRVRVFFHMRLKGSTGIVKVRCFGQKCQNCSYAQMEDPSVDPENITILMMNLVTKIRIKCYKESLDFFEYDHNNLEVNSPHDPENCEGCREGFCTN